MGADDASGWWQGGFNWPWWWHQVNGVGQIRWNLKLDPGQSHELRYTWHYFSQ